MIDKEQARHAFDRVHWLRNGCRRSQLEQDGPLAGICVLRELAGCDLCGGKRRLHAPQCLNRAGQQLPRRGSVAEIVSALAKKPVRAILDMQPRPHAIAVLL